jgi:hypothetical protein
MAKAPKKLGTSNLKQMIESDKVIVTDFNIINELTTFIERRSSFEAEDGCHDDLVMCMVIYAWAVQQDYFREMTDQSIRKELYEKDKDSLEADMSPFGFIEDGSSGEDQFVADGDIWTKVHKDVYDEYGTTMGNWEWGGSGHTWGV